MRHLAARRWSCGLQLGGSPSGPPPRPAVSQRLQSVADQLTAGPSSAALHASHTNFDHFAPPVVFFLGEVAQQLIGVRVGTVHHVVEAVVPPLIFATSISICFEFLLDFFHFDFYPLWLFAIWLLSFLTFCIWLFVFWFYVILTSYIFDFLLLTFCSFDF